MRANRTIGIQDCDRTIKDGLKALPDIQPLGLAADQYRYRLKLTRDLLRRLGGRDARLFGDLGCSLRCGEGIELRRRLLLAHAAEQVGGFFQTVCGTARLGFTYEGTFRQHMVVKDRNRDTAWFSMLDSEWPAARDAFDAWLNPENFDAEGRQRRSLAELRDAVSPRSQ